MSNEIVFAHTFDMEYQRMLVEPEISSCTEEMLLETITNIIEEESEIDFSTGELSLWESGYGFVLFLEDDYIFQFAFLETEESKRIVQKLTTQLKEIIKGN